MATAAKIAVHLVAKTDEFQSDLQKTVQRVDDVGKSMADTGKMLTAGLTAPIVAVGAAALAAGVQVTNAFAEIRKGTGATGPALEALQESFRAVGRQVPDSLDAVAKAIADVNTRTGFTGKALEDVTTSMLNFARVTGTDSARATRSLSQLMNALELDMSELPGVMDKLTFASQASGISAIELAEGITTAGTAFVELGFPLDKSIALFSQFEKVGARPTDVIATLNVAMTRLAREGMTNAEDAFAHLLRSIEEAPTRLEATAIAADAFGARFGDKIAEEVRGGTFAVDDFVAALQDVDGLLNDTAAATLTFGNQMSQLRNKAVLAIEPIGRGIVDAFNKMLPLVERGIDFVARLTEKFSSLSGPTQTLIIGIAGVAAAIGPVLVGVGKMIPVVTKVFALFAANPIGLVVLALAALAVGITEAYQRSETLRAVIGRALEVMKGFALGVRDAFNAIREAIFSWVQNVYEIITSFVSGVRTVFLQVVGFILSPFQAAFEGVSNVVGGAVDGILNRIGGILPQGVRDSMVQFRDGLVGGVRGAVTTAQQIINELRAPSLDLGVRGSNAAATSALYEPVISASETAGEAITGASASYVTATDLQTQANARLAAVVPQVTESFGMFQGQVAASFPVQRLSIDALKRGAELQTLNNREIEMLTLHQTMLREELASGTLTLEERNRITEELNETTRALSHVQGEATSRMKDLGSAGMDKLMGLVQQFSPMTIAMEMLGEVFKTLQPVIDAMKEPFKIMAQIIGKALIPILQAFWPPIRALAIAMSYVAEILFRIAGGIASAVGGAIAAIGGVIAKIPLLGGVGRAIQERGQDIQAVGAGFTQAGKDMKDLRESLRSMDLSGTDEAEQTNVLLSEGNKEQAKVAANTQRMADAIENGAMKPDVQVTVNVTGATDPSIGEQIAQTVVEQIDRALGESSLRESRLDGMMMAF